MRFEGIKMISWNNLVTCIQKLEELPNGGGSEIEFTYQGTEYGIVSYRDFCDLERIPDSHFDGKPIDFDENTIDSEEPYFTYSSLTELGKATDIGFSVEQCWLEFENVCIRPDFDYFTFEEIYESYESAYKNKYKNTDC